MIDFSVFPSNLWRWTMLVTIGAIPGFMMAAGSYALAGKLLGIATFIIVFAGVSSSHRYLALKGRHALMHKAVRIGVGLRLAFTLATLVGFLVEALSFFPMVEFLFGAFAVDATQSIGQLEPVHALRRFIIDRSSYSAVDHPIVGSEYALIPTYIATLIYGGLISITLLLFASLAALGIKLVRVARQED